jgi:Cof subfamily protein (haloacid dehalogenase superfamily)
VRDLPEGFLPGGRFAAWDPEPARYVVADVDGTLVGSSGIATTGVVDAVARARDAGLILGFATGRTRHAVGDLHRLLQLPGPHVFHNGAEVRADGATVAAWPLGIRGLGAVMTVADRLDLYVEVYDADGYWVSAMDERARPHWELLGFEPRGVIAGPDDVDGDLILKATFTLFEGQSEPDLLTALDDAGVKPGPAHSPTTPGLRYVNATSPDVDKGRALRAAAGHVGASLAATVAIGDALNDLPMFACAGTAIAMGQAEEEVRGAAHLVVPTVDVDGIATALDALVALRVPAPD